MSSRVQKGGTLFRPVVKSRSRTANNVSRQPSASVEQLRTESVQEASLSEGSPSLSPNPQLQSQSELLSSQQLEVETADSFNRLNAVPEERYVPPRQPTLPPTIGSSIIGIPQRPVRSAAVVIPVRTVTDDQSSNQTGASISSGANVSSHLTHNTISLVGSTQTEYTGTTLLGLDNEPNLSVGSMPTVALTNFTSTSTPIVAPETSKDAIKVNSKRRKARDDISNKQKRRRAGSKEGDDVENEQPAAPKQPRSRASSSTPRPRKRAPSPPPYDPDADPGEDIDPTTVTMASLCSDTGQGRVSRKAAEILSNHAAWKVKNREKRARMKMIMEAKKYGREEEEAEHEAESGTQENNPSLERGPSATQGNATITDDTGNGFDYSQDLATSRFNVQVRIGPNGETIIDENSLVVDRAEDDGTENYTHVVESDHTKFVNSGTYGKRYRGSRWSAEETELFYDALAQYGENYELIAYVLPGRDRKSCKNKFKVEDKRNHARINHCLDNSIPVDMKTLSRMTGKDFSGPVPEIRTPTPLPLIPPNEDNPRTAEEVSAPIVKKRSRSKSHGGVEGGVVVVGDVDNFES